MSSISTCEASSLDLSVAEMDSAVTPDAFASAAAGVSVGAAMARRGRVVEKGREFRVIVNEVGLDILKAARKIEARASIGRAGRGARRCTKDVGHVFCELKELEIRASGLTLRHWPLWRVSESLFTAWVVPKHRREFSGPLYFPSTMLGKPPMLFTRTRRISRRPQ